METTLATETARRSKLQARVGELDRTGASLLAETNVSLPLGKPGGGYI